MAFSTDQDLEKRRAGILELLPEGADSLRELAEEEILDDLERQWYRAAAAALGLDWRTAPMQPQRLDPQALKRLSVLKTLALTHEQLMKYNSAEADGFERHRDLYAREYRELLHHFTRTGLRYDWDASGDASTVETVAAPRRLVRG